MGVPLLDASQYRESGDARKRYLSDLIIAFQDYGFVRLKNHGVSVKDVQEIFDWADRVFGLPMEAKNKCVNISDGRPQRGYSAVGVEKTASLYGKFAGKEVDPDVTDAREHFDCGSPNDNEFPNRWPPNLPGFREAIESFYLCMEQHAADILEALEVALDVPAGTFTNKVTSAKNASELRLNHYPAIEAGVLRSGRVSRIWPHFDLGVITLLFSSQVGGLEVEDRNGRGSQKFVPVEVENEGELIVNISETFQRWSNDRLLAGLHQVQIPREFLASGDETQIPRRFSIAYLCKADRLAPAGTLPECCVSSEAKYENLTASEYHRQRLLQAF